MMMLTKSVEMRKLIFKPKTRINLPNMTVVYSKQDKRMKFH